MTKSEFEKRLGRIIRERDYEIIEEVYAFYPKNPRFAGDLEDVYFRIYVAFGIRIFKDMLKRVEKIKEYQEGLMRVKEQKELLLNPEKIKQKLKELNDEERILEGMIKSL